MADDTTFTKEQLDAAIEKAVEGLKESVKKLEDKNTELVGDLRKARKGAEIKPEDLTAAEERADKAEAALAAAQKEAKDAKAAADKAAKTLEAEQGFTQKLLIQDGIKSALIANGVKDEDFIDSLTAKFAGQASIKVDGDSRVALIGDKPVADHFKEWAASDTGKKFVEAPANSGGGASGSSGSGAGKTMSKSDFDALPPKDRAARMADGYTIQP